MTLLPHERRRYAEALRWLRDHANEALDRERHDILRLTQESEMGRLTEAATQDALTWAIEKLEEGT